MVRWFGCEVGWSGQASLRLGAGKEAGKHPWERVLRAKRLGRRSLDFRANVVIVKQEGGYLRESGGDSAGITGQRAHPAVTKTLISALNKKNHWETTGNFWQMGGVTCLTS